MMHPILMNSLKINTTSAQTGAYHDRMFAIVWWLTDYSTCQSERMKMIAENLKRSRTS